MVLLFNCFIAKLLNENGVNTIIDATGNKRKYRDLARATLTNFALAYTKCPLEICIERENIRKMIFGAPSEIYRKGYNGRSTTVPGLNVPFEEPLDAETVRVLAAAHQTNTVLRDWFG